MNWDELYTAIQRDVASTISNIRLESSAKTRAIALGLLQVMETARTAAGLCDAGLHMAGGAILRASIELSAKTVNAYREPDADGVLTALSLKQSGRAAARLFEQHGADLARLHAKKGSGTTVVTEEDIRILRDEFLNHASHADLSGLMARNKPTNRDYLVTISLRMTDQQQETAIAVAGGAVAQTIAGLESIRETSNELRKATALPPSFEDDNVDPLMRRGRQTAALADRTTRFLQGLVRRPTINSRTDELLNWLGAYGLLTTEYSRAMGHCAENGQWRGLLVLARTSLDAIGRMSMFAHAIGADGTETVEEINSYGKCSTLRKKLVEGARTTSAEQHAQALNEELKDRYSELNDLHHYRHGELGIDFRKLHQQAEATTTLKLPCDVNLASKVDMLARQALSNAAVLLAHHAGNTKAAKTARQLIPGHEKSAKELEAVLRSRTSNALTATAAPAG